MKTICALILVSTICATAAVRHNLTDFKTTTKTPARQTVVWGDVTNAITISVWVKYIWTDAVMNSQQGAGAFQGLVSKGRMDGSFGLGYLQFALFSGSEKIGFSFASPNNTFHTWQTTGTTVQTNSWMHIACSFTYSNGNSLRLYINGTNANGSWVSGSGDAVGLTNVTSFHTAVYEKNGSSFFVGVMSELAIWTNALSFAQIRMLGGKVKYLPLQISPQTLRVYYPMDTKPVLPVITAADNIDRDRTLTRFDMDVGGKFWGERVLSYYPNE